jgi:hypothetical protein
LATAIQSIPQPQGASGAHEQKKTQAMKYLTTLLFAFLCLHYMGTAQTIRGRVFEEKTAEPVPFAAVYFSSTYVGASADAEGYFELDLPRSTAMMPLTISALGYYSLTVSDYSTEQQLWAYLKPKSYELEEVVVTGALDKQSRRAKLALFKREFLGMTPNAQQCKILNEEDLLLDYTPGGDTLVAFSKGPIRISNRALGYEITYYLDKFEYSAHLGDLFILGNYRFAPETAASKRKQRQFERRRQQAYLGSMMHFFRALWRNELRQEGFAVRDANQIELAYEDLVREKITDDKGQVGKYFRYRHQQTLFYRRNLHGWFFMLEPYGDVYFDEQGFFSPIGLSWNGAVAQRRIGDLLPFEYWPQ